MKTVACMKDADLAAAVGLSRVQHYQALSDALIAPHVGEDHTVFYDPATKQLRKPYADYTMMLRAGSQVFHSLDEAVDAPLAQIKTERQEQR